MSQITDITLNDGLATPVARTFTAVLKDGLNCKWIYNNGSPIALRPTIAMKMRLEDSKNKIARKTTVVVAVPYTETVDSVEVTKYVSARLEITTPDSAAATDVADCLAFAQGSLLETLVSDTIEDGSFPL